MFCVILFFQMVMKLMEWMRQYYLWIMLLLDNWLMMYVCNLDCVIVVCTDTIIMVVVLKDMHAILVKPLAAGVRLTGT